MSTIAEVEERQWRGLVRHAESRRERILQIVPWDSHRAIVGGLYQPYLGVKRDGLCVWCGDAVESKRQRWHGACATAYFVARGWQRDMNGRPLIDLTGGCAICGIAPATDVDHIDALGVALLSRDWERILRAHTLANLQPLCNPCHKSKTAADRRAMADLAAGRQRLALED